MRLRPGGFMRGPRQGASLPAAPGEEGKKKPKLLLEMVISVLSVINSKRFGVISSEVKFLGCFLLALHTARVFLDIMLQQPPTNPAPSPQGLPPFLFFFFIL